MDESCTRTCDAQGQNAGPWLITSATSIRATRISSARLSSISLPVTSRIVTRLQKREARRWPNRQGMVKNACYGIRRLPYLKLRHYRDPGWLDTEDKPRYDKRLR